MRILNQDGGRGSRVSHASCISCDEAACSVLHSRFPISAATLSHHLKELSNAGLIDTRKEGKFMHIKVRRKVWKAYLDELSKL